MEHFGGFWGRLVWFGEIGRFVVLWVCVRKRERFGLLTGGGLDKDLFTELLIPISTQRAFLYIYMYIKKKSVPTAALPTCILLSLLQQTTKISIVVKRVSSSVALHTYSKAGAVSPSFCGQFRLVHKVL